MAKLKPLFEVTFAIVTSLPVKLVKRSCVHVRAGDDEEAAHSVIDFVKRRDPDFEKTRNPQVRIESVAEFLFDAPRKPLLVLIGGTSEADVMMLKPQEKFPPGIAIVRQTEHYCEVCYIRAWLDATHWTGLRWHAQRGRWIPVHRASAAEIVGEVFSVAKGVLRAEAMKAIKCIPKG